jgi:putative Holliday junction resolvase
VAGEKKCTPFFQISTFLISSACYPDRRLWPVQLALLGGNGSILWNAHLPALDSQCRRPVESQYRIYDFKRNCKRRLCSFGDIGPYYLLTMGRILAIDYGLKRTGIAVTDPLKIIASGLTTIPSNELIAFLKSYMEKEQVDMIIIGDPKNLDDSDTHATPLVKSILKKLRKTFPSLRITPVDERFTSKMASQAMIDMGLKKMERRNKSLVDEIAATLMLQEYLSNATGRV